MGATHKTTGKDVSVWIFEKKVLEGIKGDSSGRSAIACREWVVDQLKKDVRSDLPKPILYRTVTDGEDVKGDLTFQIETS